MRVLPANWSRLKAICLRAPSPSAFMAGMPPMPRSQSAWIVGVCEQLSQAIGATDTGRRNG